MVVFAGPLVFVGVPYQCGEVLCVDLAHQEICPPKIATIMQLLSSMRRAYPECETVASPEAR